MDVFEPQHCFPDFQAVLDVAVVPYGELDRPFALSVGVSPTCLEEAVMAEFKEFPGEFASTTSTASAYDSQALVEVVEGSK
jgi:hypothetical protein